MTQTTGIWVCAVVDRQPGRPAATASCPRGGVVSEEAERDPHEVERVVVLGRGGAGKSTAAVELGCLTGLPVVELDKHF